MVAGANHVKTEITVFCDDDVLWPQTMLTWMLAPFEDKQMGGVGTYGAELVNNWVPTLSCRPLGLQEHLKRFYLWENA